jgi:arabinofuranosyltransferase
VEKLNLNVDQDNRSSLIVLLFVISSAITLSAFAIGLLQVDPVDDGLISARYAFNLAKLGELSFNPSARVEGYTSLLMVVLTALLDLAGIPPHIGVVVLSLLSAITGSMLVGLAVSTQSDRRLLTAVLSCCALSAFVLWAAWGSSGLETCLFGTLWTGTLWIYYSESQHRYYWTAILLFLTILTRPEGTLLIVVLALDPLLFRGSWKKFLISFEIFLCIFLPYFLWRWNYFGYPLPNTYYAKVDRFSFPLAWRGLQYFLSFAIKMLPVLLLSLMTLRFGYDRRTKAIGFSILVYICFGIIAVGGDHFAGFRFATHLLPALMIVMWPLTQMKLRVSPFLLFTLWIATSLLFLRDVHEFSIEKQNTRTWQYIGRFLKARFPPQATVATLAIGAIGYYSGLKILDMYGIVDSHIAHLPIQTGIALAGHDKFNNDYILSLRPDLILLDNQLHSNAGRLWLWGSAAPDMVRKPEFKKHYAYVPLKTARGFINLFIRNDHLR